MKETRQRRKNVGQKLNPLNLLPLIKSCPHLFNHKTRVHKERYCEVIWTPIIKIRLKETPPTKKEERKRGGEAKEEEEERN